MPTHLPIYFVVKFIRRTGEVKPGRQYVQDPGLPFLIVELCQGIGHGGAPVFVLRMFFALTLKPRLEFETCALSCVSSQVKPVEDNGPPCKIGNLKFILLIVLAGTPYDATVTFLEEVNKFIGHIGLLLSDGHVVEF
jgi:hypothetical protein